MPRIRAENITQHKAQTRAAIVDAAEDALAAQDFGSVSLGLVADLAGLPRSTIYDYFPSLEALVAAIIEERVPALVDEWMRLLEGDTPLEQLESFFRATFEMAKAHPKLTSALLGAGRRIPRERHDEVVPIVRTIIDHVRLLVDRGIEAGEFAGWDPQALAEALTDLLAGGIDDIVGRDRPMVEPDAVLETRLGIIRAGLTAAAHPRAPAKM